MDPLRPDTFSQPEFNSVQLVNDVLAVLTKNPHGLVPSSASSDTSSSSLGSSSSGGTDSASVHNNIEQSLSGMLVRLQLLGSEYTARADTNMARIIASLPRAKREAKTLALETPPLYQNVTTLLHLHKNITGLSDMDPNTNGKNTMTKNTIENTNNGSVITSNNHYLQELELLDTVSSRLDQVQSFLVKVCTWDRLVRETEMTFTIITPNDKDNVNKSLTSETYGKTEYGSSRGSSNLNSTNTNNNRSSSNSISTLLPPNENLTSTKKNNNNNSSSTDHEETTNESYFRMAEHILALEQTAIAIQDMPENENRIQYVNDTKQLFYTTIFPILLQTLVHRNSNDDMTTSSSSTTTVTVNQTFSSLYSSSLDALLNTFQHMNTFDQIIDIIALLRIYPLLKLWNEFVTSSSTITATVMNDSTDSFENLIFKASSIVTQQEYTKLSKLLLSKRMTNSLPFSTFITEYYRSLVRILTAETKVLPVYFNGYTTNDNRNTSSLGPYSSAPPAAVECLVRMVQYSLGSSGTNMKLSTVTATTMKLFSTVFTAYPSPLDYRLRLETEFANNISQGSIAAPQSLIDIDKVISLHTIAVTTAHEIIPLVDPSNDSSASTDGKNRIRSIIFDTFAGPYLWYAIQLEQYEKESIQELFHSVPNLRLPLPLPEEEESTVSTLVHPLHFVAGFDGNFSSLLTFAQSNKLFLPSSLAGTGLASSLTPVPTLVAVESAIKGLEDTVYRFATLAGQILQRTVHLTSFVQGYSSLQTINEGIIELAHRLYATASLLADVTVFPVVTAAATAVYSNNVNAKQLSSPFGTVTRTTSVNANGNTLTNTVMNTSSSSSSSTPVAVLPSLKDVYGLSVRLWLLTADIETITLTVPSLTYHILQHQKPYLEEPLTHVIIKDSSLYTVDDMRLWESYTTLLSNVTTREKLQKLLQEHNASIVNHRDTVGENFHTPSLLSSVSSSAWTTLQRSKKHCNRLLFDALLAPFVEHIRNVRNLPCWLSSQGKDAVLSVHDKTAALADEILQYNTSPSAYITEICNLLLSFAQSVAPYNHPLVQGQQPSPPKGTNNNNNTVGKGSGNTLGVSFPSIQFVSVGTDTSFPLSPVPPLAKLAAYARQAAVTGPLYGYVEHDIIRNRFRKRTVSTVNRMSNSMIDTLAPVITLRNIYSKFSTSQYISWTTTLVTGTVPKDGGVTNDDTNASLFNLTTELSTDGVTASVTLLLQGIVRAVSAYLLHEYTQIMGIDSNGIQQLIADLDYFSAVLNSMGFTMDPWFIWWMDLLQLTPLELRNIVSSLNSSSTGSNNNSNNSSSNMDQDSMYTIGISDEEKKLLGQCMMLIRRVQ